MLHKLNQMTTAAYIQMTSFFRDLKEDERGLSPIVVSVLLILIGVFAVVFLWDKLSLFISDTWNRIIGAEGAGALKPI